MSYSSKTIPASRENPVFHGPISQRGCRRALWLLNLPQTLKSPGRKAVLTVVTPFPKLNQEKNPCFDSLSNALWEMQSESVSRQGTTGGEGLQNIKSFPLGVAPREKRKGKQRRAWAGRRKANISAGFIYISVLGNLSQFVSLQMM